MLEHFIRCLLADNEHLTKPQLNYDTGTLSRQNIWNGTGIYVIPISPFDVLHRNVLPWRLANPPQLTVLPQIPGDAVGALATMPTAQSAWNLRGAKLCLCSFVSSNIHLEIISLNADESVNHREV
jgi:hypothetical protein